MQSHFRFKVPEKVPVKVWEVLVQSQVRFNRVPEKVPEKVPGSFGATKAGSTGSSTWLGSTLQKRFVKIKRCGCWGNHRRLFFSSLVDLGKWRQAFVDSALQQEQNMFSCSVGRCEEWRYSKPPFIAALID